MSSGAICPYCEARPKRAREFTCGTPHCIDSHVKLQASRAQAGEEPNWVMTGGYRCDSCGHEQEADVACGACGSHGVVPFGFEPAKPSAAAERLAATVGYDAATIDLLFAIEKVCKHHGLARTQYALASALWRSVSQHPSLQMTVDFMTQRIVLSDGGRRISFEADVFPPRPKGRG